MDSQDDKIEFIKKAIEMHGDKYDYSLIEYKNNKTKVKIICKIHKQFEQTPYTHLKGIGCRKCSYEKNAVKRRCTPSDFIKKAKEVHGDKYDYSLVEYKNTDTKVIIICPQHGNFEQRPSNHVNLKNGCKKCAIEKIADKNRLKEEIHSEDSVDIVKQSCSKCKKIKSLKFFDMNTKTQTYYKICIHCRKNSICKCGLRPSFGFNTDKIPTCCSKCKTDGMINIKSKHCNCGKAIPSFGLNTDKIPTCCKDCKQVGMIDIKTRKCLCKKAKPSFGLNTDKTPTCCKNCKKDDMINIYSKNKKCNKCTKKTAYFGYKEDKIPTCCKDCKKDDMVNIVNKMCNCGKSKPMFGCNTDKKPTCCSKCKTEDMIDIKTRKCLCKKAKPMFGFNTDKIPTCCSKCKTDHMINIKEKKCKCGKKRPYFGYREDKIPTCCKNCKKDDMQNIVNKKCLCGKSIPSFGLKSDKIPTCCSKCKKDDMQNIVNKKCLCGKSIACFGFKYNKIPTCCKKCKEEGMLDIKSKRCPNCIDWIDSRLGNKFYDNFCATCFKRLFPNDPRSMKIYEHTKEIMVRNKINEYFDGFIHDTPLYTGNCDCTHRRRVDHRKLIGNTILAIETDEFGHSKYNEKDEEIRYDDLYMIHSGKWIFIRFNPDDNYTKIKNRYRR